MENKSAPPLIDVLICTYDTGDKNALLPIITNLNKQNLSYKILAFGISKKQLESTPFIEKMIFVSERDVSYFQREDLLTFKELENLDTQLTPYVVIAGMASRAQAQVLNYFYNKGRKTIALYDNFDPFSVQPYTQPFFSEIKEIDTYMIPLPDLIEPLKDKLQKKRQTAHIEVVGQPALEQWADIFQKTSKQDLLTKLHLDPSKKTILFVGGAYEDNYPENLKIAMKALSKLSDFQVLITTHPKSDGHLEKEASKDFSHMQIVKNTIAKTSQLACIADLLITHKSTVGVQALSIGTPVIYVAPEEYHNFAIDKKLASRVGTEEHLLSALSKILGEAETSPVDLEEATQLSHKGSENIVAYLVKLLKK